MEKQTIMGKKQGNTINWIDHSKRQNGHDELPTMPSDFVGPHAERQIGRNV